MQSVGQWGVCRDWNVDPGGPELVQVKMGIEEPEATQPVRIVVTVAKGVGLVELVMVRDVKLFGGS
jgi:hypothetical protein